MGNSTRSKTPVSSTRPRREEEWLSRTKASWNWYVPFVLWPSPPLVLSPPYSPDVCADVQSLLSGKDVLLQTCGSLNQNLWSYDTSTLKAGSSNLCMTYASTSPSIAANDVIELTQCTNAATWKFYDTVAYSSDISGRSFEKVHIVSMEDSSKCLSVSSASNRADVIYANCNLSDQRQNWATNELGQMFLKDYTNLCIQVLRYTTGTDVKLRECDSSKQSQQFVFDGNHDNEITPVITADLCLTYDTRRRLRDRNLQFLRRKMTLELCNGSDAQGWIFNDWLSEMNPEQFWKCFESCFIVP